MFTRKEIRTQVVHRASLKLLALPLVFGLAFSLAGPVRVVVGQNGTDEQLAVVARLHADGKLDEATSALQIMLRSHPNLANAHLWLARTHFGLGDWKRARECYTRYTELAETPDRKAEGWRGIARTHMKEGNSGLAAASYEEARQLAPEDVTLQQEIEQSLTGTIGHRQSAGQGFFQVGLFGVCGGRNVWWGWVLGLLFYVPGIIVGAANTGQLTRHQFEQMDADPENAAGAALVYSIIGAVIGFIIFWGLPATVLGWCLVAFIAFTASSLAAAAAAS